MSQFYIKISGFGRNGVFSAMGEPEQPNQATIDATVGAISSAISRTITSPLEVIKIRFQVQLEPTTSLAFLRKELSTPSKYTGIIQASKDILKEEGLRGFWRGNVPGLLMVMPYTAIQFTVFQNLRTLITGSSNPETQKNMKPYESFLVGGLAGCAATIGSYPFDLLKTVLASQGKPKVYPNIRSAIIDITRTRGFFGLYAGLQPALAEIFLFAGIQFGTYDILKHWATEWNHRRYSDTGISNKDNGLSEFQKFNCGMAATICASLASHPLDVVRKRLQIAGIQRHPKYGALVEHHNYRNMFDAIRQIMKSEGMLGLYKGVLPFVLKAAPAGAITFVTYELVLDWLLNHWAVLIFSTIFSRHFFLLETHNPS